MKIGILTSGGDCQGLNRGIVELVRNLRKEKCEPVLLKNGFQGLLRAKPEVFNTSGLGPFEQNMLIRTSGSFIGSSRLKLRKGPYIEKVLMGFEKLGLDGLCVFGGDGSLNSAKALSDALSGCGKTVVGIPKTIDNDIYQTQYSLGFRSAVEIGYEAICNIQDTATSHKNIFLVEVMGRQSGMLAAAVAESANADALVIPEVTTSLRDIAKALPRKGPFVVVVAEGAKVVGEEEIFQKNKSLSVVEKIALGLGRPSNLRTVTLGHVLRGGKPCSFDQQLAVAFAKEATKLARESVSGMVVVKNEKIEAKHLQTSRRFLSKEDIAKLSNVIGFNLG